MWHIMTVVDDQSQANLDSLLIVNHTEMNEPQRKQKNTFKM